MEATILGLRVSDLGVRNDRIPVLRNDHTVTEERDLVGVAFKPDRGSMLGIIEV